MINDVARSNSKMNRRALIGVSLASLLIGCQTTTETTAPTVAKPKPALAAGKRPVADLTKALLPKDTQELRIVKVDVVLSESFKRNAKQNGVSNQRIQQVLSQYLTSGLQNANARGSIPVRAEVVVNGFTFADPALAILLGSNDSVASARTTLFYMDTGQQVGRGVDAGGGTKGRATIFAAAAIKSPEGELKIVAQNMPGTIKQRLFGRKN